MFGSDRQDAGPMTRDKNPKLQVFAHFPRAIVKCHEAVV